MKPPYSAASEAIPGAQRESGKKHVAEILFSAVGRPFPQPVAIVFNLLKTILVFPCWF